MRCNNLRTPHFQLGCVLSIRKNRFWFIVLFTSVFVVNTGYSFLSLSTCLETALWANRISYLGSVFLPLSMLMIILNVTNTPYKRSLSAILLALAAVVFLIAASPGILDIYYKEVSFQIVNGVSTLVKVYGPLHHLYPIYLLGYFAAMVTVIIRAQVKRTIDTTAHAVFIAIAVFVNIGVWAIEQIFSFDFEMLSISYIISELFLLAVHLVISENERLKQMLQQTAAEPPMAEAPATEAMLSIPITENQFDTERIEAYLKGIELLTPTEREIFHAYIARATTKEIMAALNIKESTLKFHNRNLYGKLGVSSRKELLELHKQVKT